MNERISLFNKALENNLRHKAKLHGEDGGKLMYEELIKRLRKSKNEQCYIGCFGTCGDCKIDVELEQAADAIEELQKAVLRLEEANGILDELPMVDQRESPEEET